MLRAIFPSTPAAVLCWLHALMTRLRCLVHACFHTIMGQALQLRIKHLPERTLYASISGPGFRNCRQGISYTPADVVPLMWIEEQRLLGSFLGIIIFYEVRKMDADFSVLWERSETIYISSDDTVEGFWRKIFGGHDYSEREQIATTLNWLDAQAGGRKNIYSWLVSGPVSPERKALFQGD